MGVDEVPRDAVMSIGIQRGNVVMAVQAALQGTVFSLRKGCASTQLKPWMSPETPQPLLGCSAEMWLWVRSVPRHPPPPRSPVLVASGQLLAAPHGPAVSVVGYQLFSPLNDGRVFEALNYYYLISKI